MDIMKVSDEKDKQDPTSYRNGPVTERSCTDPVCALLFLALVGAMVFVGYTGYINGQPEAVIYPYDSAGNQCGRPGTSTEEYKYVYFLNPFEQNSKKWKACVKQCPIEKNSTVDCYLSRYIVSCNFTVNTSPNKTNNLDSYSPQKTYPVLWRLCWPSEDNEYFRQYIVGTEMMSWGSDIIRGRWGIIVTICFSFIMAGLFYLIIRFAGSLFVYLSATLCLGVMLWAGIYYTYKGYQLRDDLNSSYTQVKYYSIAALAYISAIVFILVFCCFRQVVSLAIVIGKCTSLFLGNVGQIILVPFALFIISTLIYIAWFGALLCLYSSGTQVFDETANVMAKFQHDQKLLNLIYFEAAGIIWINGVKLAIMQFIVAYATFVWYFSENKSETDRPVSRGVGNAMWYHFGSLCFGSLLLCICAVIKWVLVIISKLSPGDDNALVKFLKSCTLGCVTCLEQFVKFLDHAAYIRMALTGENFCVSAKKAFDLLLNSPAKFSLLFVANSIICSVGIVVSCAVSTYAGYYYLKMENDLQDEISSPIAPVIIFALTSYLVVSLALSIYEICSDTLVQAYVIDEKIHNRPLFAPEPLMEYHKEEEQESY